MAKTKKISKKAALKQVEKKLKLVFSPLEPILGNKDFNKRMKNAGKVLMKGLKIRESQLALANLEKLDVSKNENEPHKKNGMKAYSPQTVVPPKRKAIETNNN
jgi:hypothetical protein